MGRSRYVITEPDKPHFLTCTVMEWLPVFTRPDAVTILLDAWSYQRHHNGLRLYGYVILENHLHFVAQAPRLDKCVSSFKSFTATQLIELLEQHRVERVLQRLRFAKRAHKRDLGVPVLAGRFACGDGVQRCGHAAEAGLYSP